MKTPIEKLEEVTEVQSSDGNWNYNPYMQGLANGLILALAIMKEQDTVNYFNRPESFIEDEDNNIDWSEWSIPDGHETRGID